MKKLFVFAAAALMSMSMFAENITVAKAVEIGKALGAGNKTTETYTVEGYVAKLYGTYYADKGTQSFWMYDEKNVSAYFEFEAFQCTLDHGVSVGAKVTVTGQIENYQDKTMEIKGGTVVILEEAVPVEMTFAEALEALNAIKDPNDGKTNYGGYVKFVAYATSDYEAEDGKQTVWLAADKDAEKGDIQAFKLAVTEAAPKGAKLEVIGTLAKYMKAGADAATLEVVEGSITILEKPMSIENTAVSVKAQKVMENGQLFIIRNGVKYNAAGAVVE